MSSTLQIAGAVAVVTGVALISIPAGLIVGGVVMFFLGLALGR
jgi:hypothetical protein